jgi:RNA polymerase sigma-70 factor (ECF subfamily)
VTWDDIISQVKAGGAAETDTLVNGMDQEVFSAFYQRTARPLWAYLARVSGNATLADDFLQESYLRFLCAERLKDDENACRAYLFRIATNLMRDHWRRPQTAALDEVPEAALAVADRAGSERVDSVALLGPAFARLKPKDRQLLWLAYAEGYTHREIAEITGLGAASIRLLLFRARRKLARWLREKPSALGRTV